LAGIAVGFGGCLAVLAPRPFSSQRQEFLDFHAARRCLVTNCSTIIPNSAPTNNTAISDSGRSISARISGGIAAG
jgi:hypothetical protein